MTGLLITEPVRWRQNHIIDIVNFVHRKLFRIPWLEWPLIYDIRARPYQIKSDTGTKDLQMVDLGLRILYRPNANQIPWLAKNIGLVLL